MTVVLAFLFVFTGAYTGLHRFYSQKFFADAPGAQWIWAQHQLSANVPVAFFATRDFDLPPHRAFARLKILGDPEYTIWLNGVEVAGRMVGEERQLDEYDVSALAKDGRNRIVIAIRAKQGVGGLIAALDIAPEIESYIATNASWRIYQQWRPELLVHDPPDMRSSAPLVLGKPPYGRWNFLERREATRSAPVQKIVAPRESFEVRALMPTIRTASGVAVAVAEPVRATAYDFGFTSGRVRITIERAVNVSHVVNVRFANAREELEGIEWNTRTYVFAGGERVVVDPEIRNFRYVLVYGARAKAEVLQ